jgi:hypothetical protein
MRIWIQPIFLTFVAFSFGGSCLGDTLTLKNGDVVEGTYLGGTSRVLRMEVNGRVQTYDVGMVVGLQFTNPPAIADSQPARSTPPPPKSDYPSSSDRRTPPPVNTDPDRPVLRRAPDSASDIRSTQDPNSGATNNSGPINTATNNTPMPPPPTELPAGTRITVRMIDSVDSQVARVGDTFRASVDEPVSQNGVTVIPRGADVVAKLVEEDQSGKISGRTTLKLVLSSVRVNDRNIDIVTSDVVKESSSRGTRSAGVIGGTAAVGAIIGGIAGGGKGAAIGAGSGAAVGTGAEVVGKGQRVKVPSETRLDFTLSYSVRI